MKINFLAPINTLSYGVCGLNLLKAAQRADHEIALWPIGSSEVAKEDELLFQEARWRTNFFDPNAPSLRLWHQFSMAERVGRGLHAGFPIFELDRFNDQELHHLNSLELIFATSNWAREVLNENGIDNVHIAPMGVDRSIFHEKDWPLQREGNPTVFLNVGKWEYRKGHDILLKAFSRAFNPTDNVRLVMACHSPFLERNAGNQEWRSFYLNSPLGREGKIEVLTGRFSGQKELATLMQQSDCGVFPSRAEGWNLPLLEMMSCGKHVIATDFSAHTEFCTNENCFLIPVRSHEVANDGVWFHGQGNWAQLGEEEIECLVDYMRTIHALKTSGNLGINQKGVQTAQQFSWDRTVSQLVSGLSQ